MSAQDALFRVMAPVADALAAQKRRSGEAVDETAIAEEALQAFASSIALDGHSEPLRQRLVAHLGNQRRNR